MTFKAKYDVGFKIAEIFDRYLLVINWRHIMNGTGSGDIFRKYDIRKQKTLIFDGE